MRRLLLDSHALLWWLEDHPKLGPEAKALIEDDKNAVFVSAASGWEIAIKRASGKLETVADLGEAIAAEGFEALPITFAHAERAGGLPPHHRDPFDRMLIAQAEIEGLELVSADSRMALYDVKLLSADT